VRPFKSDWQKKYKQLLEVQDDDARRQEETRKQQIKKWKKKVKGELDK
jgi:hypothetical protein